MKFKIDKAEIINEFQSLAAVADKKQTLPILSNILIRCETDSIRLLSTDLEVELDVSLEGASVEQPGETTIPAKKAADIIRELPEGQVSFELNEESSKLTVRSTSGKYNLSTIPGSDFPDLEQEFNSLPHDRGTLSMARAQDPNSANSQFFICFQPAPFLDRQYTVFGKVIEGMEFVDKIKRGDQNNNGAVTEPDKIISFKSQ